MTDQAFRKLMEGASSEVRAAGKKALAQCPYCIPGVDNCFHKPEPAEPPKKPAIRIPKHRTPNKTEARFMHFAVDRWDASTVTYSPITLHLPSGCKYTPDVMVQTHEEIILCEVKGPHIHNQRSIHAFKEARAAFPFFRWIFAQWKGGDWLLAELPTQNKL